MVLELINIFSLVLFDVWFLVLFIRMVHQVRKTLSETVASTAVDLHNAASKGMAAFRDAGSFFILLNGYSLAEIYLGIYSGRPGRTMMFFLLFVISLFFRLVFTRYMKIIDKRCRAYTNQLFKKSPWFKSEV